MSNFSLHTNSESIYRILRKTITRGRSLQRVSAELTWTFALLPFQFSMFIAFPNVTCCLQLIFMGLVIALFSTGITNGQYTPDVTKQFLAIKAIIWTNCGVGMLRHSSFVILVHYSECLISHNLHNHNPCTLSNHSALF